MTAHEQPERTWTADQLHAALTELGGTGRPPDIDDLVQQAARMPQRPTWTFPERWIPMTVLARPRAAAPPLRRTWLPLAMVALVAALAAGLILAAALLDRRHDDRRFDTSVTLPSYGLVATWDGTTIPGLSTPSGMDIGPDGNLYVVNAGAGEILVLRPDGTLVTRWGSQGTGEGQFDFLVRPEDIGYALGSVAVGPDGLVSVADTMNDRIQQFRLDDRAATFVRAFGGWGTEPGRFFQPYDLTADVNGDLLVIDNVRGDIQRFDGSGGFLGIPVATGNIAPGPLYVDGGVAVDGDTVSAVDYEHARLNTWGPDGELIRATGQDGDGQARLKNPFDVAIGPEGAILVTEPGRLVVYGPDGRYASDWAAPAGPRIEDWQQVAVAPDGTAYVSAPRAGRIYKLAPTQTVTVEVTAEPTVPAIDGPSPVPSAPAGPVNGTAVTSDPLFPVPFTATLPPRWSVYETTRGRVSMRRTREPDNTPVYVVVSVPLNAFEDPCHAADGPRDPRVGPSVEDMVGALTHLAGYRPTTVTDEVIGGRRARAFDLENASLDIRTCSENPWLRTWTYDGSRSGATTEIAEGDIASGHSHVAILDVDGTRVLVWLWAAAGDARMDEILEAQAVVDSIRFQ